jgi:hypothetical protein
MPFLFIVALFAGGDAAIGKLYLADSACIVPHRISHSRMYKEKMLIIDGTFLCEAEIDMLRM